MISTASSCRVFRSNRGSTLAAALALAFLIFAVTSISLARIAAISAEASARRNQASALFLAEAGIQKAAHSLTLNPAYSGEQGTRLPTGCFDTSVVRSLGRYIVTAKGHADSPFKMRPHKTVCAVIIVSGRSFRISDWRENP